MEKYDSEAIVFRLFYILKKILLTKIEKGMLEINFMSYSMVKWVFIFQVHKLKWKLLKLIILLLVKHLVNLL